MTLSSVTSIWAGLAILQGALMLIDELYFHRRRSLPKWERIGHPIDTFVFSLCIAIGLFTTSWIYWLFAGVSCLLITKDEWVHAELCEGGESWLHSALFLLHSSLLILTGAPGWGVLAQGGEERALLELQCILGFGFGVVQWVGWNLMNRRSHEPAHQQRLLRRARKRLVRAG